MKEIMIQHVWEESVGRLIDYKLRKNEAIFDFDNMCVKIMVNRKLSEKVREVLSNDLLGRCVAILLTDSESRPVIVRVMDGVKPHASNQGESDENIKFIDCIDDSKDENFEEV